jgi:alanyl-tRNA synthetase
MESVELRGAFLEYFERRGHRWVGSSSLIPRDDPTLLFTNAGMVQFKRLFTGEEKRDYQRATTSQKCVRAGGKHNDLENVGYTARHHTFFEMLGNFSFGDYFKSQAISFAFELLTERFKLPSDKLYVTVYKDDDEAATLWPKLTSIPADRIIRLGEKDNFWAMGDTGPCGPCSEILIDQGPQMGCGRPDCAPGCDCDRYLEIWNLVFMQFQRDAKGDLTPLPRPSIDTGMGLERLAAVVQKVPTNFETDLFQPLLTHVARLSGIPYVYGRPLTPSDSHFQTNVSTRVIADHCRAIVFLISDGVRPENLGRGYVLRRVIRRAVRHGRKLGLDKPFLSELTTTVIQSLKSAYPELTDQADYVKSLVLAEETRFGETLGAGLAILNAALEELSESHETVLAGSTAFKLYDTFGFPLDLVRDAAREKNLTVDEAGFEAAMSDQRAKGRAAWRAGDLGSDADLALVNELTGQGFIGEFIGYETLTAQDLTPALLVVNDQKADQATIGQEVSLVFPKTPFYAASGGQSGDVGRILFPNGEVTVSETLKGPGGVVVHRGLVATGTIDLTPASLEVDSNLRRATAANHSATHLLHQALRQVLGDHVRQAGSLVTAEKLRFDYTQPKAPTDDELALVESKVNGEIILNWPIVTNVYAYDEAVRSGATALFEERYGETVRVVSMGSSRELCGGTHAERTGDIGFFLIAAESPVAAGVRRLECVTGQLAVLEFQANRDRLRDLARILKTQPKELTNRVQKLTERVLELSKAPRPDPEKMTLDVNQALKEIKTINGINCLAKIVPASDPKALREIGDLFKAKLPAPGVLALAATSQDGQALILVAVSPDLTDKLPAGRLIGPMAAAVGGRGGGKPNLAQAGGPNGAELPAALAVLTETVQQMTA